MLPVYISVAKGIIEYFQCFQYIVIRKGYREIWHSSLFDLLLQNIHILTAVFQKRAKPIRKYETF